MRPDERLETTTWRYAAIDYDVVDEARTLESLFLVKNAPGRQLTVFYSFFFLLFGILSPAGHNQTDEAISPLGDQWHDCSSWDCNRNGPSLDGRLD